jgi:Nucleotidyl transferase AbiEii toxin, Type IV TA system
LDFSQDIDIVVSNGRNNGDAEHIKDAIVHADDRYLLEPSQQPGATHRILYCRLPGWWTDGRRVKIDILVPPTLKLPEIQDSERIHFNNIPVMPIFDLLVMKTKGWFDHRLSDREDYRAKGITDVSDIIALLRRAEEEGVSYDNEVHETRHSEVFMRYAANLVKLFVRFHGRRHQWQALGFPV